MEEYRLKQLDKQETRKDKVLSKEERETAIRFLEQKDLLQRTNEMIGKSGEIREETNRLLMYLIFTSRKIEHPLHVISLGNSGIGKTHLQEKVGELSLWKYSSIFCSSLLLQVGTSSPGEMSGTLAPATLASASMCDVLSVAGASVFLPLSFW